MAPTSNLIISEEALRTRLFSSRPSPQPGVALVLFREGHPLLTIWPDGRLTSGEMHWGKYRVVYRVDVSDHTFAFNCTLPCQGEAFEFQAQVDITYRVSEPNKVVEHKATNAEEILKPLILESMRNASRNYEVDQSRDAEAAIKEQVLADSRSNNVGIQIVRLTLKLSLEEETRKHLRRIGEIRQTTEYEKIVSELKTTRAEEAAKLAQKKAELFLPLIRNGQWDLLAVQLANDPDNVASIAQALGQLHQTELENQLRTLKIMLDEDIIESAQVAEVGQRALRRFIDSFGFEGRTKALGSSNQQHDDSKS